MKEGTSVFQTVEYIYSKFDYQYLEICFKIKNDEIKL